MSHIILIKKFDCHLNFSKKKKKNKIKQNTNLIFHYQIQMSI